jgi:transposase
MKRIGEDVAEKLDYAPGVFTVERHVRGKWVCAHCETLVQAPVAPHIIDKGIPTTGAAGAGAVAKYADHLPLYRQEASSARAGFAIPRSTLAQWVGTCGVHCSPGRRAARRTADPRRPARRRDAGGHAQARQGQDAQGLPLELLHDEPSTRSRPSSSTSPRAAPASTRESSSTPGDGQRLARHARLRRLLGLQGDVRARRDRGRLPCARARKFHELWDEPQEPSGEQALKFFAVLYDVEREAQDLDPDERRRLRQEQGGADREDNFRDWLEAQRVRVPDGSATRRPSTTASGAGSALTRYLDDGDLPCDNNWVENQIRPIAIGRSNWLFAGSLRAGKRAAAIMSLVHSARINGHDPYAYLKDVLERLPTQPASRHSRPSPNRRDDLVIRDLLPHRWRLGESLSAGQ